MQLPLPMLSLLQRAVDQVIIRNPQSQDSLAELDGSVIQIEAKGFDASLFLVFTDQAIELARVFDNEVDVKLSGTPIALMSMIRSHSALFKGEVSVTGDVAKSRLFKQLVSSIDVDLEEELSGIFGDTVAHQAFRIQRSVFGFLSRTTRRSQLDTRDYLQEEAQLLPHPAELNRFNTAVDELRSGVDRMEARLNLLVRQSSSNQSSSSQSRLGQSVTGQPPIGQSEESS